MIIFWFPQPNVLRFLLILPFALSKMLVKLKQLVFVPSGFSKS